MFTIRPQTVAAALLWAAAISVPAWADPASDSYALAAGHYTRGQWRFAAEEFAAYLAKNGDLPQAASAEFFLAEALSQLGRHEEAHRHLVKLRERHPAHRYAREALFREGEVAYFAGRTEEAAAALGEFRRRHPNDPLDAFALVYLADAARAQGNAALARSHYEEAIRRFPSGPLIDACRFGLARALDDGGDTAGAETLYAALAENGSGLPAADARLELGGLQFRGQRYEEAARTLTEVEASLGNGPRRTRARYLLAVTRRAQGRWNEIVELLETALRDDPASDLAAAMHFYSGEAHLRAGNPAAARERFHRVLSAADGGETSFGEWADDALLGMAQAEYGLGEFPSAVDASRQVAERFSGSPLVGEARLVQARALIKLEKYAEAVTLLEETPSPAAGEQRGRTAALAHHLGLAYLGVGRFEEALEALELAAGDGGGDAETRAGIASARAAAYLALGRFAEAVEPLRESLRLAPNGPGSGKSRAELVAALAHAGKVDDALVVLLDMRGKHPGHALLPSTMHYVAESLLSANHHKKARELFTELTGEGIAPDWRAKGLAGMARCDLASGQFEAKAAAHERLAGEFPSSPLVAEIALARARALTAAERFEEAAAAYRTVIERDSTGAHLAEALAEAARLLDRQQRDAEAAPFYARLVEEFPDQPDRDAVLYDAAWSLQDQGLDAQANALFSRLRAEYPASRFWADATYRLAERAATERDFERAAALAGEIAERECGGEILAHALLLSAQASAAAGKWHDVAPAPERLLAEFPAGPLTLAAEYWIAEALYRQGRYEAAGLRFEALAAKTENRREAWVALVPLRRAQLLVQRKQWREAHELARAIPERFPDFQQQYEVDYVLGRCLASQARFDEARAAYERVVQSTTGGRTETAAQAQWMIGESYFHQRNYDEAIRAYLRVEILYAYPNWQAAALLQAGKCHEIQGEWTQAAELYARAARQHPGTPYAEDASARLTLARQRAESARSPK
jgi:TolA-binding protein